MKRFITKLILVITVLTLTPSTILAEEVEINGINYELITKAKIATVIAKTPKYSGDIVIPSTIENEGITYNVTSIGEKAFYSCDNLNTLDIPNSVTSIGNDAFGFCSGLKSINIPNSVTSIGENAFCWCKALTFVNIPNSVTSIRDGAFYGCTGLTTIDIPKSVTSIGKETFTQCSNLASIFVNANNTTYDSRNNCNAIIEKTSNTLIIGCKNTIIPNSVTSIGNSAFVFCSGLKFINIPNSVTSIGELAFGGCSNLTSIDIPNSVTTIGKAAFSDCSALESVVLGDGVSIISEYTFQSCEKIKAITLGSNISIISISNFYNCKDLEIVTCKATSVPSLDNKIIDPYSKSLFENCYIEYATLIVPDESIDAYKSTAPWSDFGTIKGLSGQTSEIEKCATPTINFTNGKLTFTCDTEGAACQSSIKAPDAGSYSDNEIQLGMTYTVEVYATKPGYDDSDVATMTIDLSEGAGKIKGDINGDGYVNMSDVTEIINIILGKQ